jgi:phage terminase large subunit-like protein
MGTYCVTYSEDDWGETADQFQTKAEAEKILAEAQAAGRFARMIRWQNNQCLEVKRVKASGGK